MISWWITPKNNKPKEKQFVRIIMITAFIGLNKSLKNPINNLVLILPIMVNDMKVAPIVTDKWILTATPDRCWEIPVIEVCKRVNKHIQRKLMVSNFILLFWTLVVSFLFW